jgi:EAL domain-containing protein (putative c-di-GMP-specific phosphodiesterase class I)
MGVFGALVLILLVIFLTYLISRHGDRKFRKDIKDQTNTVRVYIIDIKNNTVRFFNRSNIREQRIISVTDFYNQFPNFERDKLIEWIGSLIDATKTAPDYFEIDVIMSKNKKAYFSMLQVQEVNKEKQIIHLESYLLRYLPPKVSEGKIASASSMEDISRILLDNSPFRGVATAFNFYSKRSSAQNKSGSFDRLIFTQIKEIISPHITQNRYFIEPSQHEIVVFDTRLTSHSSIMLFVHSMVNDINRFLSLNSLIDQVGISVGIVEHKFFPNEAEKLLRQSTLVAAYGQEDNELITWYEQGMRGDDAIDQSNRTEVENIIRNKKLKFLYRPILDSEKMKLIGYQSFVQPFDTFFDSIGELKEYATRTEDDRELFGTIARNVISHFINEKSGDYLRLFFDVLWQEKPYILKTFGHINRIKETHIVLVFNEKDVGEQTDDDEIMINELRAYKVKGYEVALKLADKDLLLNSTVYDMFDFFILDEAMTHDINTNSRRRLQMRSLVEKLLKYNKPIIATDLQNWNAIELIIKSGIHYVASETISASDEMILPVSQKSLNKIKAMAS